MRGIRARVRRSIDALEVGFRLDGDLARIRAPSPADPRLPPPLWQHTCFEAFVAAEGREDYHELDLAPCGEWAGYRFRGYRRGRPMAKSGRAPRITVRRAESWLELDALVLLADSFSIPPGSPLRLGLAAVVEASDGALSYWSLRHPPGRPDFHHAFSFALRLEPPGLEC